MTDLIFLDTETTGLDDRKHEVWEIAWARNDDPVSVVTLSHRGLTADPDSLEMNGYWDRATNNRFGTIVSEMALKQLLKGQTLICSNPTFDRGFLKSRWGSEPWHHRSVDISSYAMPILGHDRPMGLARIAEELSILGHLIPSPSHSAAGDVETLREAYKALKEIREQSVRAEWKVV